MHDRCASINFTLVFPYHRHNLQRERSSYWRRSSYMNRLGHMHEGQYCTTPNEQLQVCKLTERSQTRVEAQRENTLVVAKKVNQYQSKMKETTRRTMALVSELSMNQVCVTRDRTQPQEQDTTFLSLANRQQHCGSSRKSGSPRLKWSRRTPGWKLGNPQTNKWQPSGRES